MKSKTSRQRKRRGAKQPKPRPRSVTKARTSQRSKIGSKTRRELQTPQATQVDAVAPLVTASAEALGLTIDPAWLGGVTFNLQLILRLAALVDEFHLPGDAEPAPVFHA